MDSAATRSTRGKAPSGTRTRHPSAPTSAGSASSPAKKTRSTASSPIGSPEARTNRTWTVPVCTSRTVARAPLGLVHAADGELTGREGQGLGIHRATGEQGGETLSQVLADACIFDRHASSHPVSRRPVLSPITPPLYPISVAHARLARGQPPRGHPMALGRGSDINPDGRD